MIETRGGDRAERRRVAKATSKALAAKSRHGRVLAARDLELARRNFRPSVLEQGLKAVARAIR